MKKIIKNNYEIFISEKKDWSFSFTERKDIFTDIIVPSQPHGTDIIVIEENTDIKNLNVDGLISNRKNLALAVKLADCNGIVFMWENYYWVVHGWWKGLKNWIIEKCIWKLSSLGEKTSNLEIFVGPSIRICCYEVWNEFKKFFEKKYLKIYWEKIHLDMIEYIKDTLKNLWISKININPKCTKCSKDFFSYRNGNIKERFLVGIKKI